MTIKNKIFHGGIQLGTSQAISQGCSFLRNVIIARMITPDNFGIAATIGLTMSLVEMISNLSVEKLVIQSPCGDEEEFLNTVHMLQFVRGIFGSVVLYFIASPISNLFGIPDKVWAFKVLAIVPIIRGLIHQDINRLQRGMMFRKYVMLEISTNIAITLLAYPIARQYPDYSSMLWIVIIQVIIYAIGSHLLKERPFRWDWNRTHIDYSFKFGWPLLVNGILMFLIFQGDRFIIGSSKSLLGGNGYSLKDLGTYSVAFAVTFMPTSLVANVTASLFLPVMAEARADKLLFVKRYDMCCKVVGFFCGLIYIPIITSGDWLVRILFGAVYADNTALIQWLAGMQTFRTLRVSPTLAAMSLGDTKNMMYANFVRIISFPVAFLFVYWGYPLHYIAICGFGAEAIATTISLVRLKMLHHIGTDILIMPAIGIMLIFGLGVLLSSFTSINSSALISLSISLSLLILFVVVAIYMYKIDILNLINIRETKHA